MLVLTLGIGREMLVRHRRSEFLSVYLLWYGWGGWCEEVNHDGTRWRGRAVPEGREAELSEAREIGGSARALQRLMYCNPMRDFSITLFATHSPP